MRTRHDVGAGRRGGRVHCEGLAPPERRAVRRLLDLIGAREWQGEGEPGLVIIDGVEVGTSEADKWRSRAIPVLTIGESGRFRMPEDAAMLAEAVLAVPGVAGRGDAEPGSEPLRIMVAGWQGGVGTSSVARTLAGGTGAVLVDATGFAPGVAGATSLSEAGIRWADLDPDERAYGPELADALATIGGIRMLVGDTRGGADCADLRLAPVVAAMSCSGTVIDAGRWDGRAHRAHIDLVNVLVLVGRGDLEGAQALAYALSFWPPEVPFVLVHARKADLLAEAAPGVPTLPLCRVLGRRKGGKALAALVAGGYARTWARTWGPDDAR